MSVNPSSRWRLSLPRDIKVLLLVGALIWVARYWDSRSFGLYADDYSRIPAGLEMGWDELWSTISWYVLGFRGQGRPFHSSLIYLFSFLGGRLGGLRVLYWIGFSIITLNAFLLYLLLKRRTTQGFALLAALAFCLYSADTTQALLTHALGLQPAITFFLLAAHSYLSRRKVLAYSLLATSLVIYETPFLLFLAMPLLDAPRRPLGRKSWLGHGLILGGLLVGDMVLRSMAGEGRVLSLTLQQALSTSILHMLQGPLVSLGTYGLRPLQALKAIDARIALRSLLLFPFLFLIVRSIDLSPDGEDHTLALPLLGKNLRLNIPREIKDLINLLVAGVLMIVLAYPLTFTVRAYAISGRDTRVHFAAALGASIIVAFFLLLFLHACARLRRRTLGNLALGLYMTLMVAFGFVVQRDYQASWLIQKTFWRGLLAQSADAGAGTIIITEPGGLPDTQHIDANTWAVPHILDQLFEIPESWDRPPRAYRLIDGWEATILDGDGRIRLDGGTTVSSSDLYGLFDSRQVIFLSWSGEGFLRPRSFMTADGREILWKARSEPVLTGLPRTTLYDLLIGRSEEYDIDG